MKKYSNIADAYNVLCTIVEFLGILGFDPDLHEDFGTWVNEIDRDVSFIEKMETALIILEDLQQKIGNIGVKAGVCFD